MAVLLLVGLSACGPGAGSGASGAARVGDYVRADRYSRLVIEVDAVPGFEPRATTARDLVLGLDPLLDKPGGIEAVLDGTLAAAGSDHAWTFDELAALADATDDCRVAADTVKMHVLFVDGHDEGDVPGNETLGLAWGHSTIAVFAETVADTCARVTDPDQREAVCAGTELWVWTHETGHLLGLVNLGVPMVTDHEDPDHPHHDASPYCVMYWATRGEAVPLRVARRLAAHTSPTLGFDAACQADLAAVRNATR